MADEVRIRLVGSADEALSAARAVSGALNQAGISNWPEASTPITGTKGEALAGALAVKVGAQAVSKLMDVLVAVFKRPHAPLTEIEIETKDRKIRLKFNPASLAPSEIKSIVRTISRGL